MTTERRIRVVLADDHELVREGIRRVLADSPGIEVVGEGRTGDEVLDLIGATRVDVVVLDLTMPGTGGLDVLSTLEGRPNRPRTLVLSMHEDAEYVLRAVRSGADGYLMKDEAGPDMLRRAIAAVDEGESFFSPRAAAAVARSVRLESHPRSQREGPAGSLTPREKEVLQLLALGHTNKEMAAKLGISRRTVESHRESLMRRLEIRTVAGLTRFALDNGLLDGEDLPPTP